ncbi:MAG: hypothetical protein LBU77_01000, partial [Clostridiales bacterium]|nr:hypothetical protein [Clostridiales bacterium]
MKDFRKILRPLRRKITIERLLRTVVSGIGIAAFFCAVLLAASKFFYMPSLRFYVGCVCGAVSLFSLAAGFVKRPGIAETAEIGDRLGLKQRLITTYEILHNGATEKTAAETILIRDTFAVAAEDRFEKRYKIRVPVKLVLTVS